MVEGLGWCLWSYGVRFRGTGVGRGGCRIDAVSSLFVYYVTTLCCVIMILHYVGLLYYLLQSITWLSLCAIF